MKKLKKGLVYCAVMLSIMILCSCSSQYGTEKNPAGVGQTMYYDGTHAKKEKNRFKAEITLEDVVRGEEAQDIFAAAGGYADYHEALELSDEEELMVARFTFTLTDAEKDAEVDIGERDVTIFNLVSEDGTVYDYFLQRRYIKGNLFENAAKGSTQTGALFYMVDKEDKNPAIVFLPSVNDGIWFQTNLNDKDKEKVEKPLLASDWLDADGKMSVYAGTLNTPLPIGEFGYMKCRSSHFGDYEIEIKVNDVLRGEPAEDQLYLLNAYALEEQKLLESQEYMLVNLTANVPSAHLTDEDILLIDSMDFGVINSGSGEAYDYENILYLRPYDLCGIAPGGTAAGWVGVIVDKDDASPMMYYQSLDDKMLYFKLDKAYDVPDGLASYEPDPVFSENPIRDEKQEKGHWMNPYKMGETVDLNYAPRRDEELGSPFTGSICVQEAYRGELAEKFIDSTHYYTSKTDMEFIIIKIAVNVLETDGNNAPRFDADGFTMLTGQGGEVVAGPLYVNDIKAKALETVYPGGKAEGYVGFLVPMGIKRFVMTYGDSYTGLDDDAWISLEFSEQIPKDVEKMLEEGDETGFQYDMDGLEYPEDETGKTTFTALWSESDELAVGCAATGEDGKLLNLEIRWARQYSEEQEADYHAALKEFGDSIESLRLSGDDITLESDDEQRILLITEKNVYEGHGPYEVGFILETIGITLDDISDENNVPAMKNLEKALELNGFQIG